MEKMKINIKKTIIFSAILVIGILLCLTALSSIRSSIQKQTILKIGISETEYNEPGFNPDLVHCFLFKKNSNAYKEELAIISSDTNLITGIKDFKFADGSNVTIQEVKASLPEDFFNLNTDIFHTPLTKENISKYFTSPVTSKDGLSCGAYNILNRNQNEAILAKNQYYTGNFNLKYEKIVFRKIDLSVRNEDDILNDLIEKRVDVLINIFSPQKTFKIINKYPQLKIHTYSSSQQAVLMVKRDSLTSQELSYILTSIDIAYISKFIYNSTLIPVLDAVKALSNFNSKSDKKTNKNKNITKNQKNLYFLTTSSSSLLRASKIILSKFDTSMFSPVLQVIDEDDLKDFTSLSKNANLVLTNTDSSYNTDHFEQNGWISIPLWKYQDIVLSNNKIKDPSVFIK